MKIRVRFPDGSTEKIDVEPNNSVQRITEQIRSLPSGCKLNSSSLFLSLNRKDSLDDEATISGCGVCGGDLVYLMSADSVSGGFEKLQVAPQAAAGAPSLADVARASGAGLAEEDMLLEGVDKGRRDEDNVSAAEEAEARLTGGGRGSAAASPAKRGGGASSKNA